MALYHVAHGPGAVVEGGPAVYAQLFRVGNLYVVDIVSVPQRLKHGIGEAEHQHVLYRALSQIVVNPVDLFLPQEVGDPPLQRLGAFQVVAERFLDHNPSPAALLIEQTCPAQLFSDYAKFGGTDRHVEGDIAGQSLILLEPFRHTVIGAGIGDVTAEVFETTCEAIEHSIIDPVRGFGADPIAHLGQAVVVIPVTAADGDDAGICRQLAGELQLVECRHELDPG